MQQANHKLSTSTKGKGLYNITREIKLWVTQQKFSTGLLTIFVPHTSASIIIQENADPDVLHDLTKFFQQLVPEGMVRTIFTARRGSDDMPGTYSVCSHTNPDINSSKFREPLSRDLAGYLSIRTSKTAAHA